MNQSSNKENPMQGQAMNIMMVTAALLLVATTFNERLFATQESAGCMGCHQGDTMTTVDDQVDQSDDTPKAHPTSNNQTKASTN
jgi:hypothetical protein